MLYKFQFLLVRTQNTDTPSKKTPSKNRSQIPTHRGRGGGGKTPVKKR